MVPSHRPGASRRGCSPSGIPFGLDLKPSTNDAWRRPGIVAADVKSAATAASGIDPRAPVPSVAPFRLSCGTRAPALAPGQLFAGGRALHVFGDPGLDGGGAAGVADQAVDQLALAKEAQRRDAHDA